MRRNICQYRKVKPNGKGCKHFEKRNKIGYCQLLKMNCVPWHLKKVPFHLSHSAIQTWSQCRYKFYLSQLLGWKPRTKSLPLIYGTIGHDFLAKFHSEDWDGEVDIGLAPDLDERQQLMMEALLRAYTEKVERFTGRTEVPFFTKPVGEQPYIYGYVDVVREESRQVNDENVKILQLWEHKFGSRPDNYNLFTLTEQFATYWMAFPNVDEFYLNYIRIPAPTLGNKERKNRFYYEYVYENIMKRPKYYFIQERFFASEIDITSAIKKYQQVWRELLISIHHWKDGAFYQERNHCFSGFGQCDYYPICECTSNILEPVVNDELFEQTDDKPVMERLDYLEEQYHKLYG